MGRVVNLYALTETTHLGRALSWPSHGATHAVGKNPIGTVFDKLRNSTF